MRLAPNLFGASTSARVIQVLSLAALIDWLIGRTLTRSAIFMPKSPVVLWTYQGLTAVSQVALTATSLLAVMVLGWLAWTLRRRAAGLLSLTFVALIGASVVFIVRAPTAESGLVLHLLMIGLWVVIGRALVGSSKRGVPLAWLPVLGSLLAASFFPAAAFFAGEGPVFGSGIRPLFFFRLSEILALAGGFALWLSYGRAGLTRPIALLGAIPALAFLGAYLAQPSMTGILSIWSTGFTLSLPWPLYPIAIWCLATTLRVSWKRRDPAFWPMLLLLSGGLAPQWSTHVLLGVIALGLVVLAMPLAGHPAAVPAPQAHAWDLTGGQGLAEFTRSPR